MLVLNRGELDRSFLFPPPSLSLSLYRSNLCFCSPVLAGSVSGVRLCLASPKEAPPLPLFLSNRNSEFFIFCFKMVDQRYFPTQVRSPKTLREECSQLCSQAAPGWLLSSRPCPSLFPPPLIPPPSPTLLFAEPLHVQRLQHH